MSDMCEILFRGRQLNGVEWFYGDLSKVVHDDGRCYVFPSEGYNSPDWYEVDPDTVGQYIGLDDKNGVKIFKGDVLHFINTYREMNTEWLCVVDFLEGAFVCRYVERDGHAGEYNHFASWNTPVVQWDVIGNVYDNPELLEEVQQQ